MNLIIIGSSVEDHIIREGIEKISPGGIWFSALAFSACKQPTDNFFLVTGLEKAKEELFSEVYSVFNTDYIFFGTIPRIHLTLHRDKERDEKYENISSPLNISSLPKDTIDGIYINLITGTEILPEQIVQLKQKYHCPVYIDIHSLARAVETDKPRKHTPIQNAKKWIECADYIQGNEIELEMLTGEKSHEKVFSALHQAGVTMAVYTSGSNGVALSFKKNNSFAVNLSLIPEKISDSSCVGCGDIFGATLFTLLLKTKNLFYSLRTAVTFAEETALAVKHERIQEVLRNLKVAF